DGCDPKTGCTGAANTAPCDDGNTCTTKDICSAGICKGNLGACNDNNPCTDESCPSGTCVHTANTAPCNDSNACTSGDVCKAGVCGGPGKLDCDDTNLCTDASCDAGSGCVHVANAAQCDDGNPCTAGDACVAGSCAGNKVDCDDTNPCTDDSCAPKQGCVNAANAATCTDGNPCTSGDACQAGKCGPGKAKSCDDNNVCTQDSCLTSTGQCQNLDTSGQDCDDKNACTDDVCHPVLGCGHANTTAKCSDGDPCTTQDQCSSGKCQGFAAVNCDDGKPCTDDSCDSQKGCVNALNSALCNDGVECTVDDACSGGLCKGTLNCSDGQPCTLDSCNYTTGKCNHASQSGTCDDGDKCTLGDTCQSGQCLPAEVKVCDDGNVCTDDSCDSAKGCVTKPNTATCNAMACTWGDACSGGKCVSTGIPRLYDLAWSSGSTSIDTAWASTPTSDGGHLVGGLSQYACSGCADLFVQRWDASGKLVWTTKFVWSGDFKGLGFLPDADGSSLFLRAWSGSVWVTKLDSAGKELWTKHTFFGNQPGPLVMAQGLGPASGTAFGCGLFYSGWNVLYATLQAYDRDTGAVKWTQNLLEDLELRCLDLAPQPDGSVVWVGYANAPVPAPSQTGKPAPKPLGKSDVLLVHITADGTYDQQWRFGGSEDDSGNAIAAVSGGHVIVGTTKSAGAGDSDIWVLKVGSDGTQKWQLTLGGPEADQGRDVAVLADGSLLVLGTTTASGVTAPLLAQIRSDGKVMWQRKLDPGASGSDLKTLALQADGGATLVGTRTTSSAPMGGLWLTRVDAWGESSCANAGTCADWTPASCDEGNPCTLEWSCDPSQGCDHTPSTEACDDADPCTSASTCQSGACKATAPTICDDQNPCTSETCDNSTQQGCVYKQVPDGTQCGGGKSCSGGNCQ
ncbi:MAG: PQQ-like beta-propeller repeat protein, partial [Deltaproteobacteria bacterium]|nr:PQQ-like beta-propeller repeat protein [Deltaproteobacteria bacterium]